MTREIRKPPLDKKPQEEFASLFCKMKNKCPAYLNVNEKKSSREQVPIRTGIGGRSLQRTVVCLNCQLGGRDVLASVLLKNGLLE